MYPKLFEIGPVPVYSYGLMLGIAFLVGNSFFTKELKRNGYDENVGIIVTLIALIGGVIGSKLFYVLEEWNFGSALPLSSYFTKDILFSPSGLTFYGGLILALIAIIIFCRIKKIPVLKMLDMLAPSTMLSYGIARIGCHLSGDGDYGKTVNGTFWEFLGYSYSKGTVPTPPGVLVHPTSVYEFVACTLLFIYMWKIRKKYNHAGMIFYLYLILAGIERFLIEIIRLNPKVVFNLSQAQLISIIMMVVGGILFFITLQRERAESKTA
ncbi:prolipoprotein diacylglyceryl transferase [soil metagenome]